MTRSEATLTEHLRRAEREAARLRLAIARALTLLPGRPEAAETVLERAMEGKHGK